MLCFLIRKLYHAVLLLFWELPKVRFLQALFWKDNAGGKFCQCVELGNHPYIFLYKSEGKPLFTFGFDGKRNPCNYDDICMYVCMFVSLFVTLSLFTQYFKNFESSYTWYVGVSY